MLASIRDVPPEPGAPLPSHVMKGKELLERLRKIDPKVVGDAERFLFESLRTR